MYRREHLPVRRAAALHLATALVAVCWGVVGCGDDAGSGGAGASSSSTQTTAAGQSTTSTTSATATTSASSGSTTSSSTGSTGTGGGPIGCLTDLSAGHHEVTCDGGIQYDVEIPDECTQEACGLVVDLHGYTMTGDAEDENTGMRALGQANGYVIVQPTAPSDNLGFPSWDQATHAPLVHAFLTEIAAGLPIDSTRVHAMGFSQGGGMTFRLLCDHADFFASGAPIGALQGCPFAGQSTPSEEVDILHVHGHTDNIVSFSGVAIPQRDAALAAWPFGPPEIVEQDAEHTATRRTTASGTVYEFWEHDYATSAVVAFVGLGGHCVPGGEDFDGFPAGYSCEDQGTFVFGELAMAFFQAHPKR